MKTLSLYWPLVLFFTAISGLARAQSAPSFGRASNFAVLAGTSITATGAAVVTGNVGVSPGTSVTGFPPALIRNGQIYTGAASKADTAQLSALTIYNYLAAQTSPSANNLSGMILGETFGAIVLTPGVYFFSSAAQINTTLTLDDGGDSNAIFIFQIGSTLTTAVSANVVMSSGGRGVHVYWQVGTSATIGTSTSFIGHIIAYTSVTMNTGATTTGRVFGLNGAVSIDASNINAVAKTWDGGAHTHSWGDAANWDNDGVPLITDNLELTGADTISIALSAVAGTILMDNPNLLVTIDSGDLTVDTNIAIFAGQLNLNTYTLNLNRSISGSIVATNGTLNMSGSAVQTIPASLFTTNSLKNLVINNPAGVSLGGAVNLTGALTVDAGVLTTGSYLTLISTATQTALIDGSSTGTVSGSVTMQRYLDPGFGYKYISSPFSGATVGGFGGYINLAATFPTFYSYDENQPTAGWVNYTSTSGALSPLQGYAANFGASLSPQTVSLTGAVNNGTFSSTRYNHNQTYTLGFNLAGNPYPSPIDWDASGGWGKTNIDNAVYYYNTSDTNQYIGTYSSYVGGVSSDGLANNIVPAMQGFFVHVSNGSYPVMGTLSVNNAARVNNLNPLFHKLNLPQRPLVRLSARFSDGSAPSDAVVLYLHEDATGIFNKDIEALKPMNTDDNVPNFYTVSTDAYSLAIHAVANPADSACIAELVLQTENSAWLTISATNVEDIPVGMKVLLYDTQKGVCLALDTLSRYKVYLNKGKYRKRFFLMFTYADRVAIPGVDGTLNAYTAGQKLFVYVTEGKGKLVITNMLGQIIGTEDFSGNGYHEVSCQLSTGLYVATLYSDMGKQSKKVLIGNE